MNRSRAQLALRVLEGERTQPATRALEGERSRQEETVWFCGHCAARPAGAPPRSRVCARCGLGLLLAASAEMAPAPGSAFLVLDEALSICAVSEGAERRLAVKEPDAVNRHVTDLLEPADSERHDRISLAGAIFRAARGQPEPLAVTVRPARTFGVRMRARVGGCGPGDAALLVFE